MAKAARRATGKFLLATNAQAPGGTIGQLLLEKLLTTGKPLEKIAHDLDKLHRSCRGTTGAGKLQASQCEATGKLEQSH